MAIREHLLIDDKLTALRKGDPLHAWQSLDDARSCILCERTFNGRQATISINRLGEVQLHCPTVACQGTALDWVPTVTPAPAQGWGDWQRVLRQSENGSAIKQAYFSEAQ